MTGAGSGIGRAGARLLASSGASVIVTDIDGHGAGQTERLIVEAGGILQCDAG